MQIGIQLLKAIATQDTEFVASLISPDVITISVGAPAKVNELGLDDPDAFFWQILYKAMDQGCDRLSDVDYVPADAGSEQWIRPNITPAFYEQYPPPANAQGIAYEISHVIVVGDAIDVHVEPDRSSLRVAQLSNEVVLFDQSIWGSLPNEVKLQQATSLDGWTPVILPNDMPGHVSNRYAYRPLDARVILGTINGNWQILSIPSGD